MQNDTKHKKKKAPIICAAIVIGLLAAYLAVILFALIGETHGELFALIIGAFFFLCLVSFCIVDFSFPNFQDSLHQSQYYAYSNSRKHTNDQP